MSNIRPWIAAAAIAAAMTGGVFAAVPAHADTYDDAFLDTLAHYDVPEPGGATGALAVGHTVCSSLRTGTAPMSAITLVYLANTTYTTADAAHFVGAAIGSFCPEQKSRLENPNGGSNV
jgi:hypothetical protein